MRFGFTPIPGSNPGASAAPGVVPDGQLKHRAPVAQRREHLTTDQGVRGSNPLGRATADLSPQGNGVAACSTARARTVRPASLRATHIDTALSFANANPRCVPELGSRNDTHACRTSTEVHPTNDRQSARSGRSTTRGRLRRDSLRHTHCRIRVTICATTVVLIPFMSARQMFPRLRRHGLSNRLIRLGQPPETALRPLPSSFGRASAMQML